MRGCRNGRKRATNEREKIADGNNFCSFPKFAQIGFPKRKKTAKPFAVKN